MLHLLTLLLLFIAPHETALAPVLADDGTLECSDDYYWEPEHNYYTWEGCLFDYSGTIDNPDDLSSEAHTALYQKVWSDYMGDTPRPTLRRWSAAVSELCGEDEPDGCAVSESEVCGPWLECRVVTHVVVKNRSERLLLHEVAHAIYTSYFHHPVYGMPAAGSDWATDGHSFGFRCLLLDIYNTYTDDVAADAYNMLSGVCESQGW